MDAVSIINTSKGFGNGFPRGIRKPSFGIGSCVKPRDFVHVIYIANWPERRNHAWKSLLVARAIENQVYVLAPAQQGKHPRGLSTYGKSLIVDPWGDVIAQASDGEGFAIAPIDLAYEDRVRASVPCLTHRRM